jgi:hypothetical protein
MAFFIIIIIINGFQFLISKKVMRFVCVCVCVRYSVLSLTNTAESYKYERQLRRRRWLK